jgi:hypothetical protein
MSYTAQASHSAAVRTVTVCTVQYCTIKMDSRRQSNHQALQFQFAVVSQSSSVQIQFTVVSESSVFSRVLYSQYCIAELSVSAMIIRRLLRISELPHRFLLIG